MFRKVLVKIRQWLAIFVLKIIGWHKGKFILTPKYKKGIIIGIPHTSYWDTFYSVLGVFAYLPFIRSYALFKKEANKSFWGKFYRVLGGIPVDRKKKTEESKKISMVKSITEFINNKEYCFVGIAPEATRKRNDAWKTGFYYIALESKIPIFFGVLDYKKKEISVPKMLIPSGNFDNDIKIINDFYKNITAKYPEKFALHKI